MDNDDQLLTGKLLKKW